MAYQPTAYSASTVAPEAFYGSLLDANGRQTEVFVRMADAFFFWLDANCTVPWLRGTGIVEPAKYAWMSGQMGASPEACALLPQCLPSLYTVAGIPHTFRGGAPVLERRGFLHLADFELRASPNDAHRHWNAALARFALRDPRTDALFPTPVPRASFALFAEPAAQATYTQWRVQSLAAAGHARVAAMLRPHGLGAARGLRSYSAPMGYRAFGYAGLPRPAPASRQDAGGSGDHATVLDTVNNVATLANTFVGAATGGGGGGGSGLGLVGGLLGAGLFGVGGGFGGSAGF